MNINNLVANFIGNEVIELLLLSLDDEILITKLNNKLVVAKNIQKDKAVGEALKRKLSIMIDNNTL